MATRSPHILLAAAFFTAALAPIALHAQTRILVCESHDAACSRPGAHMDTVWTFDGTQGTATSPGSPETSIVTIETFSSDTLIVRRSYSSGLTARYTGKIDGTHISGNVEWFWPGHTDYPPGGIFTAALQDQPAATTTSIDAPATPISALPSQLLVCENNGVCNAAWLLNGSEGTAIWFARNPVRAKLTVVRSAPDDILIRRTDLTDGLTAVYAGRLRGDHYSGTIIYSSPGHPGDTTGTWTAVVPQTTCDTHSGIEAADALRIGQNALMFHRDLDALGCYTVAASDGDATAQVAVGLIYYQGRPNVAQDYKQAFFWLKKAADQGVYAAQRTVAEMYLAGQGTPRDATLAGIYKARADEQKHDLERRQDLAEREADRRNQLLSSFVLGASFGLFF